LVSILRQGSKTRGRNVHRVEALVVEDRIRGEGDDVLHRRHDLLDVLVVQLEHAVQDADLVVTQRFLALTVELQERLELRLLVRRRLAGAEHAVEQLCNRVRDRRCAHE
jgi:hypothetical protein